MGGSHTKNILKVMVSAVFLINTNINEVNSHKVPFYDMRTYERRAFRTLNCWECFESFGKFCHDKDHESMYDITKDNNPGHGICCPPDS
jgi:hypothetical protein